MRKQTKLWTMKNGIPIRICDMTNNYLRNTIRLLSNAAKVKVMYMLDEAIFAQNFLNGEMAILSMEQEEFRLSDPDAYEDFLPKIYWNMLKDLERREGEAGARRRTFDAYKRKIIQSNE